jgi:hypothetical protein
MAYTVKGNKFSYTDDQFGNIRIVRLADGADVYLQGDDTNDLRDSLANLELIEYPSGPFKTFEEHLDVVLDQYETVLEKPRHRDEDQMGNWPVR